MGLIEVIEIIKARIVTIIAIILIFALAGFIGTSLQKPVYQASASIAAITLTPVRQQDVDYFLYENFYSVQAGSFLAESVSSWLTSPSVVAEIYAKSQYQLPSVDARKLGKTFSAVKQTINTSVVDYSTKDTDREKAQKLVAAAGEVITQNVKSLGMNEASGIKYETVASQPVVVETPKKTLFNTILAALAGLIFGIASVFFQHALKAGKSS